MDARRKSAHPPVNSYFIWIGITAALNTTDFKTRLTSIPRRCSSGVCSIARGISGCLTRTEVETILRYREAHRDILLELYSLSAHQYTGGIWTAPETRRINPAEPAATYCVPAQISVPLLVRWILAFEDPNADSLWLCKATPREWLKEGATV